MNKSHPRKLLRFIVHLTDHCNLNCKGCGHYSPIARKKFLNIDLFKRDCVRLSDLTNRHIERIELMGGEPLLHPQLIDIIIIARSHFDGKITIVTNGILLLKQEDNFWKACRDNKIDIDMTVYPINLKTDEIKRLAQKYGVNFVPIGNIDESPRLWYHNYRDIKGTQDSVRNFNFCKWANNCILLEDGKLSTCVMPLVVKHFNKYFKETFETSDWDYIDIYKANNIEEILKFLSRPIPFCRYCLPGTEKLSKWEMSKKEMHEWI